jgi:hypothetical protein
MAACGVLLVAAGGADAQTGGASFWGETAAPADSLGFRDTFWGPVSSHPDSQAAYFGDRARPGWETAVMVPYWVIGLPFRLVYYGVDQTVIGMDRLGLFGVAAEYPGVRGPWGTYIMPMIAIGDNEGFTLGAEVTRPDFLGEDNLFFMKASTSTRRADEIAGGTLFHLGPEWTLQIGGGGEKVNLTRYYGLGYDSFNGNLSYYQRQTSWGGFELARDLGGKIGLEFKNYFSRVEALEPRYRTDQALGRVHRDAVPFGYPGESNGWTTRLAFVRNNADQSGRPGSGGFQDVGVSFFTDSDGSGLKYLTYHVNVEKFFSLWHTDRTLAVRGFLNRIDNAGTSEIPFTRLVTFQRPDELRGFTSLRFYDKGSVGFSTEYRWPVWVARGRDDLGLDAYLFSDIGQVYHKTSEISLNNVQVTGGLGLRLIDSQRGFAGRFELGLSEESAVVRLKFSQTFQYDPKGLLYGKNPTKVY